MRRRRLAATAIVLALGAGAIASTFTASPLPAPPPLDAPLPPVTSPPGMTIRSLATGATHRSAAVAYRGGSVGDAREFSMTVALVTHPKGDVLIDTGFGRKLDEHLALMGWAFRAVTTWSKGTPAADRMAAAGYDTKKLRGVVLTHAHWDHVSGLPDFPDVPVWINADERAFAAKDSPLTAVIRSVPGVRYQEYAFDQGPYLGFPRSHDVYGDGAIVLVPVPGHTPGSAAVFVTLPSGRRYLFVGDLVWQREGITEREERPWLVQKMADDDPALLRGSLLRVAAVHARYPEITLVPAHDPRGFADMPPL